MHHHKKHHLLVFADPKLSRQGVAPRPDLGQVLYTPPNPDGSIKYCQNCILWCSSDENCVIHNPDVVAPADAVCGYHVFGEPNPGAYVMHNGIQYVTPELSGLVQVVGGTSCSRCRYYNARTTTSGRCSAVRYDATDVDAPVEALGCCARWEEQ